MVSNCASTGGFDQGTFLHEDFLDAQWVLRGYVHELCFDATVADTIPSGNADCIACQ
jgi:hypothetical protein